MLHLSAIDSAALVLLKKLQSLDEFKGLRLVGGTALALQIGHRKSIDLDLFGDIEFKKLSQAVLFSQFDHVEVIQKTEHINIYSIDGVKVDFVNYSYPWLQEELVIDGINIAGLKDIAAMKLAAITGRGSKKDFVDIYFLLKSFDLGQIIEFYNKKYFDASTYLAIKSLTYFDDADQDMDLDMLDNSKWNDMKDAILKKVALYSK